MTVYVVGYTSAYEGGDIIAVYSSRELAEASWQIRNQEEWGEYEIFEFELDLDPKANEPDIDRRPRFGPKTQFQQRMSDMFSEMALANLTAPSPLFSKKIGLPMRTGNKIEFFKYQIGKSTTESI